MQQLNRVSAGVWQSLTAEEYDAEKPVYTDIMYVSL